MKSMAIASAVYEAPEWGIQVKAEHIAYEFYRVRRYHNGILMMDANGGREEMERVMQVHAEWYETHMELPHYEGGETQ